MRGSLSAELLKLRTRPATWLMVAAFVLISLFAYVFPYLSYSRGVTPEGTRAGEELIRAALPSSLVPSALSPWALLGGAVALVLGALASGSEYGWDTVKTTLTQRPGRLAILGGKLTLLGVLAAIMVVGSLVLDAVASAMIAGLENRAVDWPPLPDIARDIAAGWLIVTMWSVVGVFLATLLRGTALTVGIGLVWLFVLEQMIRAWFAPAVPAIDMLQRFMPGTNAGSLVAALGVPVEQKGRGNPGITDAVGGTHATIVLTGYVIALAAATAVVLRRRDVT